MLENRLRMFLERYPKIRKEYPKQEIFTKQGIEWLKEINLPKAKRKMLNHELQLLEELNEKIKSTEVLIDQLAEGDERVKLLESISGIGKFFAVLITYKIERFRDKKKLISKLYWACAGCILYKRKDML
jgi:transposase